MEFDLEQQTTQFSVILRAGNPGVGNNRGDGYVIVNNVVAGNDSWYGYIDGTMHGFWLGCGHPYSDTLKMSFASGSKPAHWKIKVFNEKILVYFNNSTTPNIGVRSDIRSSGAVGFRVQASTSANTVSARIKNFSITVLDSDTPDGVTDNKWTTAGGNFTDNFDGTKTDQWLRVNNGDWKHQNNELVLTKEAQGPCFYFINNKVYRDFTMEFDLLEQKTEFAVMLRSATPIQACNGFKLVNNANKNNDTFFAYNRDMAGDTAGFWDFGGTGVGFPVLNYADNSTFPSHWKIVASGNTIQVYYNNSTTPHMGMKTLVSLPGAVGFLIRTPADFTNGAVAARVKNFSITVP